MLLLAKLEEEDWAEALKRFNKKHNTATAPIFPYNLFPKCDALALDFLAFLESGGVRGKGESRKNTTFD